MSCMSCNYWWLFTFEALKKGDHIGEGVGDEMREKDRVMIVFEGVGEGQATLLLVLVDYGIYVSRIKVKV